MIRAVIRALFFFLGLAAGLQNPTAAFAEIRMAVTIDDLPTHSGLPPGATRSEIAAKIISALKKHRVPRPYGFVNAGNIKDPELLGVLRQWRGAGFPLGNHGFLHRNIDEAGVEGFKIDIEKDEEVLRKLGGASDWHYFRYPYLCEGSSAQRRDAVRSYLKTRGYSIAQVTVDFGDWAWNDPYVRCAAKHDAAAIGRLKKSYLDAALAALDGADALTKALAGRPISHVLLLHLGPLDAEMLDSLLSAYEKKGVRFISLPQAQQDELYASDPGILGCDAELPTEILRSRHLSLEKLGIKPFQGLFDRELDSACAQ